MARILLIDDDAGDQAIELGRGLEAEGHNVIFSGPGRQALSDVELVEYDLLVTDAIKTGVSGANIIRRARACRPATPIVATCERSGPISANTVAQMARDLGATHTVQRPLDARYLARIISGLLNPERLLAA